MPWNKEKNQQHIFLCLNSLISVQNIDKQDFESFLHTVCTKQNSLFLQTDVTWPILFASQKLSKYGKMAHQPKQQKGTIHQSVAEMSRWANSPNMRTTAMLCGTGCQHKTTSALPISTLVVTPACVSLLTISGTWARGVRLNNDVFDRKVIREQCISFFHGAYCYSCIGLQKWRTAIPSITPMFHIIHQNTGTWSWSRGRPHG